MARVWAICRRSRSGALSGRLRRFGHLSGRGLVPRRYLLPLSLDLGTNYQFVLEAVGTECERLAALVGASVQHRHEAGVITLSEHNGSAIASRSLTGATPQRRAREPALQVSFYRATVKRGEEEPGRQRG